MKNWKTTALSLNLAAVLVFFGLLLVKNEQVISNGPEIYLQLRPVDPRSIMQGDYMELNYSLCNEINKRNEKEKGYAIVGVDKEQLIRLQDEVKPVNDGEVALKYTAGHHGRNGRIRLSNHSYFFQEGTGSIYSQAKYALVKVDKCGNIHIVHLCDHNKKILGK
ncbi:MAG: GDYXXLXY domain-containing protein [Paludibacteraceae bacterium]|nr:GDYXXLXY domain-containing protein [Paludibacteraceae bacterium]MBR6104624.1 GDYXXLXY domain-containing protein [Paludibacteraceae bacterium]